MFHEEVAASTVHGCSSTHNPSKASTNPRVMRRGREATPDIGRPEGGYAQQDDTSDAQGCGHRAYRALVNTIFDVVANPVPSCLGRCEEPFPEGEKEAEFQVWWRDEKRAEVGSLAASFAARHSPQVNPRVLI